MHQPEERMRPAEGLFKNLFATNLENSDWATTDAVRIQSR